MRAWLLTALLLTALAASSATRVLAAGNAGLRIDPGDGAGDVTARTSESRLVKRFGRRSVMRADVPIGQGQTEPGTILFPRDPRRTLYVLWKSQGMRVAPKHARVSGEESAWTVAPGIRLGTTLVELEAINGGPFTLSGFGGDYGGTVLSWDRGALDLALGPTSRVAVRLAPPAKHRDAAGPFAGESLFRSDAMREINPRVYEIAIDFD